MDHIDVNRIVTLKSLETNRTPEVIGSVIGRLEEVYDMSSDYLTKDMTILDIGTKDCLFFDILVDKGFEAEKMVGIDCCTEVVEICMGKGYMVYEVDAQNTGFIESNSFDFIFIIHTLEHVPSPESIIIECTRLLKPNGFVFIEVPIETVVNAPEEWGHYHPFKTHQQLKDIFYGSYTVLKEDRQKTASKKPWYRVLFQRR